MKYVLIVEDSPDQALMMRGLLTEAGYRCHVATNGQEALAEMEREAPDAVVTDLVMPEIDGLELVQAAARDYPGMPVVLVTAFGSGEVAVRALKKGAASYIPKRRVVNVLVSTIEDVLSVAHKHREQVRLLDYLEESSFRFSLGNDQGVIDGLVSFVQDQLRSRYACCNETVCLQTGVAIREALRNAMHHGNLEVDSSLRDTNSRNYDDVVAERLADPRYNERQVRFTVTFSGDEFRCEVLDEGPGFDPADVPDPTDPENLLRARGRGLYLINAFMNHITHNDIGNGITMIRSMTTGEDE